jgi:predicted acyltransferase
MRDPIEQATERRLDEIARTHDRMDEYLTQGAKGVAIINGGGAVAMLGLMQALAGKDLLHAFKVFGILALAIYAIGVFLSSTIFIVRYREAEMAIESHPDQSRARQTVLNGLYRALMCFVVASMLAGLGMWTSL